MIFKLNAKNNLGNISKRKFFHDFNRKYSVFVNSGVSMFFISLSQYFDIPIMLAILIIYRVICCHNIQTIILRINVNSLL